MMMYNSFSFTSGVAWAAFLLTSLVWLALIVDALIPRSEFEKTMHRLEHAQNGYTVKHDWRKIAVMFAIWFASGWYLFG